MIKKRNSRTVLLAVLMLLSGAFLGFSVTDNSSAANSTVVGFVDSDSPSGVSVVIIDKADGQKHNTSTKEDGSFEFLDLDSGEYVVMYIKSGFLSVRDSWSIPADLPITDPVSMFAAPTGATTVTINVKDGDGEVVENASVYLMSSVTEDSWWDNVSVGYTVSQSTDDEGNASFESLTEDKYDVRVEADGYYTNLSSTNEPNITLTKHNNDNKQTIRVYDTAGNPLGGATVFMYDPQTSTWTDAEKVGYTYYLKPEGDVLVYAYHSASVYPAVRDLSVSGPASFNMYVGVNTASDDDVIYVPLAPSNGGQSVMPKIGDRIIKLNTNPTAAISITNGFTDVNGTPVVSADLDVNFSGSSSTSAVGLVSYEWDFTGMSSTNSAGEDVQEVGLEPVTGSYSSGLHTVTLTVTDAFGFENSNHIELLADGIEPNPSINMTVKSGFADGEPYNGTNIDEDDSVVVFNASASIDNIAGVLVDGENISGIASYSWDFGDGSTDTGMVVNHKYDNPGTFDVVLNVTDLAGNSASNKTVISVNDVESPQTSFIWSYTNQTGGEVLGASIEDKPTHFDAGATFDNSNGSLTYFWDFGDGNTGSGKTVDHTFNESSVVDGFDVILEVTDPSGNKAQSSANVKVAAEDKPDLHVSELTFSNNNPSEGDTVEMNATLKLFGMNLTSPFMVTFYLDGCPCSSSGPNGTVIYSTEVENGSLEAGIDNSFNVQATWKAISGTHTIHVWVDSSEIIDEGENEKNSMSEPITVSSDSDSRDWTSIALIVFVVLATFGAVGYIYRETLFK